MLEQLIEGFTVAFTFTNLLFIIIGVAIGILFGVMPGVGGITALTLLIPVTFYMEPITAIAFLIPVAPRASPVKLRLRQRPFWMQDRLCCVLGVITTLRIR